MPHVDGHGPTIRECLLRRAHCVRLRGHVRATSDRLQDPSNYGVSPAEPGGSPTEMREPVSNSPDTHAPHEGAPDVLSRGLALRISLAMFLAALVVRLAALLHSHFVLDDAFITMRIARNLASGAGFVYNVGERVQACSSPLWAIVCAAIWALAGSHTMLVAQVLGGLCDAGAAALLVLLVRGPLAPDSAPRLARIHPPAPGAGALLAGLFYAGLSTAVPVATGGLETGFYVLLHASALWLLSNRRWSAAAGLGGVAILTRPDGVWLASIVLLFSWIDRRRFPWLQVALTAVVVAPYLAFAQLYYGQIVPQTILAKALLNRSAPTEWLRLGHKWFWGSPVQWVFGPMFLVGAVATLRNRRDLRPVTLWLVGFVAAFSTFASWWPWYWPPAMLGYALLSGLGFNTLLEWTGSRASFRLLRRVSWSFGILIFVVVGLKTLAITRSNRVQMRRAIPHLTHVGRRVDDLSSVGDVVMTEPLGIIGFNSHRTFYDYPGLAAPNVSRALKELGKPVPGRPDDPVAMRHLLLRVRPAVLVLREEEYQTLGAASVLTGYTVADVVRLDGEPAMGVESMYILTARPNHL